MSEIKITLRTVYNADCLYREEGQVIFLAYEPERNLIYFNDVSRGVDGICRADHSPRDHTGPGLAKTCQRHYINSTHRSPDFSDHELGMAEQEVLRSLHGRSKLGKVDETFPKQPDEIDEFVDYLRNTLIPDLWDSGSEATAEDFSRCVEIIYQLK